MRVCPDAVFLVVTNPLDAMTYAAFDRVDLRGP
jgi:malate/lactate dehydrogenase